MPPTRNELKPMFEHGLKHTQKNAPYMCRSITRSAQGRNEPGDWRIQNAINGIMKRIETSTSHMLKHDIEGCVSISAAFAAI